MQMRQINIGARFN